MLQMSLRRIFMIRLAVFSASHAMGAALFGQLSSLLSDTTTMTTPVVISRHLHCPICKTLLTEPVSTTCGHTFCKGCLDKHISISEPQCPLCQEPVTTKPSINEVMEALLREFHQTQLPNLDLFCGERDAIPCDVCDEHLTFKAVKSCLICLLSFCDEHLKPHQSMARFKGHKLVSPVEKLDQRACKTHGRPLELYCRRDERCICALCVKTGGDVVPVESERERRQAVQQNSIEVMKRMINQREDKLEKLKESAAKYQALLEKEQQEIQEVFAALMEVLGKAEEVLLAPLEDGRRCLEKEMDEKTQQIRKDILKYKEAIEFLNCTKNEEDDILFIQSYPTVPAEFTDDWTLSIDTELNFGTMRNTKTELMDEIKTHLAKLCTVDIRRIHSFSVNVALDAETAHPHLEVSADGKKVRDSGVSHDIPGGPQQFDLVGGVLGNPCITSGRAFWVVEVGNKVGWELGVMRDGANRKGKVSYKPSEGYWAIMLCAQNMYGAFEDPPVQLHLETKPQKLGVFVDCEEALVSFYDMKALSHIYSFTRCSFNGAIRPYFNPHPNKDGSNSSPLVICPVNQTDISVSK
ncbi:E3 ubiquitin-protein ligase TRIM21-like isoform X2 [Sinocyclocheilus grahami]|uniref:E3 ubiquitin-protein ligase TRIM21-like isoform X2 n=2 Tax=Sinocyclocheilus grahami TaxID=75366 RepID=UPI0007ACDCD5|nr:PREDICTED: E3 ubiquitin-protein ligase TRIM21-like isoform X2 [Sinocyclocheilus grahami]